MRQITLVGKASKKKWKFQVSQKDESMTLLEYLESKQVPIASSCRGEGVCKKCNINGDNLACELEVSDIDFDIEVDYL